MGVSKAEQETDIDNCHIYNTLYDKNEGYKVECTETRLASSLVL